MGICHALRSLCEKVSSRSLYLLCANTLNVVVSAWLGTPVSSGHDYSSDLVKKHYIFIQYRTQVYRYCLNSCNHLSATHAMRTGTLPLMLRNWIRHVTRRSGSTGLAQRLEICTPPPFCMTAWHNHNSLPNKSDADCLSNYP